jgi:hypothetical protein
MEDAAQHALAQAIDHFRPERSLETQDDFARFYVPRPLASIAALEEQVRVASEQAKFLVYGHRGCGKTSELNRLALDLGESHFTIVLSLEAENDLSDLHYTELLTALCRKLLYEASNQQLDISKSLLDDVLNWFNQVEDVTERKLSAEGGSTQKIALYFVELFSQQKAEFSTRQERRSKRQQREGELLVLINRLIDEVRTADALRHGRIRPLFAVIDSLDRCNLDKVKDVFRYTEALQAPKLKTIYTVPLAFSRDPQFAEVTRDFGDYRCTIPVLTLYDLDGQRDEAMWGLAQAILELRFMGVPIANDVESLLIKNSGGVLSVLFSLCYNACVLARAKKVAAPTLEMAQQVCVEYQNRFYERLREEDYKALSQPFPSRMPIVDDRFLSLLYATCILQHTTGGKSWYDLHPLVRELVAEWRVARAESGVGAG